MWCAVRATIELLLTRMVFLFIRPCSINQTKRVRGKQGTSRRYLYLLYLYLLHSPLKKNKDTNLNCAECQLNGIPIRKLENKKHSLCAVFEYGFVRFCACVSFCTLVQVKLANRVPSMLASVFPSCAHATRHTAPLCRKPLHAASR